MSEPFRTIRHGESTCEVFLGRDTFERIPDLTAAFPRRIAIIGEGFTRHHAARVAALGARNIETIVIPDGEPEKTMSGVESIVTELLSREARRDVTIIAIGGGVTGDLVGFAAAVFLRGVRLVHVPTTLLAQVDSSIGGKTAVNHAMGKNLIGAFHPASLVVSDVSVLATLPRAELLSGTYEALKSGVIGDPELFDLCVSKRQEILSADVAVLEQVVRRSIDVKAEIVERDERESDLRKLLNYGHTIGHGIEAAGGYRGVTHGEAVGWGMLGANEIAVGRGLLDRSVSEKITDAILRFEPARPGPVDAKEIFAAVRHDKKFSSSGMVMALPVAIGECRVVEGIEENEVLAGIEAVARLANQD